MSNHPSRIEIVIRKANALSFHADILVLKYAQSFFGLDRAVAELFRAARGTVEPLEVAEGQSTLLDSEGIVKAGGILVIGVKTLFSFGYRDIREFARRALRTLALKAPNARHLAMTLHGAGYGLDEIEAFESELAGIVDAVREGAVPEALSKISIVERDGARVGRLSRALDELLPTGVVETDPQAYRRETRPETTDRLRAAGYASEAKARVFVAMPFSKNMDDVYYFGIEGPVRAAGFLCERADLATYAGDVLTWIKKKIENAALLVADLTAANPNVYLEVGYAWGVGVPTVLLAKDTKDLRFDVRGQRCLLYDRIKDLEQASARELTALRDVVNHRTSRPS